MSDEIVVYNLEDDGTPVENVASQPSTTSGVAGASTATQETPAGSPVAPLTEGDVRVILHQELAHYAGDFRVGAMLSGQVFIVDGSGMRLGDTNFADAPFSVDFDGNFKATSGYILGSMRVGNGADYIIIDGANSLIKSSNYSAGNAGWQVDKDGNAEFNDARVRGRISTSVFVKDEVSAVGGQLIVANADVLDADMTALDSSTVTIKGDTTLAVNSILHLKDGTDEEYMRVTAVGSAPTYTVTRDLGAAYSADNNPAWKSGTAVVVEGFSDGAATYSGGLLKLLGAGTNSPKYSVFKRTGVGYNAITEYCVLGNLNGMLDYSGEEYGMVVGTAALGYVAFDPTNGLRTTGKVISQQPFTSGHVIDTGSAVALESDGLLYRTRATDLSTKNTEQTLTTAVTNPFGYKNRLLSISSTMKALFYVPISTAGTNTFLLKQIVSPPTTSTIASVTSTNINTTGNSDIGADATLVTANDAVACWLQGSTGVIRARYVSAINSTVSLGTILSVVTANNAAPPSIVKVSATETLIIYRDSNADVIAISVTSSGTTLTAGSTFTVASHASNQFVPLFVEQFPDTSAYCCFYLDTTNSKGYCVAFTYSGGSLSAGTPLEVTLSGFSSGTVGVLCAMSSSKMALFTNSGNGAGGELYSIQTMTLSGTTLTLQVQTDVENIGGSTATAGFYVSMNKISDYTFAIGYSDSTTSTVGRLYTLAGNTLTAIGNELTHTGIAASTTLTPTFIYHSPTRALMIGTSFTTAAGFAKTIDYTTNYSGTIGCITSGVAAAASALTILNGENASQSGLTTGTEYYADLDGNLVSAAAGGTKRVGVANAATKIIVQV